MTTTFEAALRYADEAIAESNLDQIRAAGIALDPFDYYVFGSVYPPLKAMSLMPAEEVMAGASRNLNLYVHIPFCDQYCSFCHFSKEIGSDDERVDRYLDAVEAELAMTRERLGPDVVVKTMYAGGGTASYLKPAQMRRLFEMLRGALHFDPSAEITYELHPGLVHKPDAEERLAALVELGVNRWVFGAQSMDDAELAKLRRGHTADDVHELLRLLEPIANRNISIDLIFGIPYQTPETWFRSLQSLVDADVPKLNIFPLMFKIGDPITRQYLREPEIFADANERLQMHYIAEHLLLNESGYNYGPVFYYSKSEGVASHQQVSKFETIDESNLLGIGVSAFGYVGGSHYYNECNIDRYIDICLSGTMPTWVGVHLDEDERLRRSVIQTLRSSGVRRKDLLEQTGIDPHALFAAEFDTLQRLGLATVSDDFVELTNHGTAHADGIGTMFVSDAVRDLVATRNEAIANTGRPTKDPFERYDYTPFERRNESYVSLMKSAPSRGAS